MLHQRISIRADQITPNASPQETRNALARHITDAAHTLAQSLGMATRIDRDVLVCCIEKVMNSGHSGSGQASALMPVNGQWEFGICVDKNASPPIEGQSQGGSLEELHVRLDGDVSYLKSFEQVTDSQGTVHSEQLEGLMGNWPGKVSFGQRVVMIGHRKERESGRFVDNPATGIYGLEEGRRNVNNRMIESGKYRPSPVNGTTQLKKGIRQFLDSGQSQIGTFDMLPGNRISFLADGTVQTGQGIQTGRFEMHPHSGRHYLRQGTILDPTGAAAQGHFDLSVNGHLILTAGRQIRQDGTQRSGFFFNHNPGVANDDNIPLPRFSGPYQARHSPAA